MQEQPNRKERRASARYHHSNRAKVNGNGHKLRRDRLQRQREEREVGEAQRAERRAQMARENGEYFQGRLDRLLQRTRASLKKEDLNDIGLEIGLVFTALVAAMICFCFKVIAELIVVSKGSANCVCRYRRRRTNEIRIQTSSQSRI